MKVTVVGYEVSNYTSKKTGVPVSGVKLFYMGGVNSDSVVGMVTDSLWINEMKNPALISKVRSLDLKRPITCNLIMEQSVGSRFSELTEIEVLQ